MQIFGSKNQMLGVIKR